MNDKTRLRRGPVAGDLWGALTATAILLPQAMAIGVTLYALAGGNVASGAGAGLITTALLCFAAGLVGGAPGVISAPTGPALVLLAGALAALAAQGLQGPHLMLGLAMVIVLAGVLQFLIGLSGGGQLIKYIPSPVISGFMTGSALLMIKSQTTAVTGAGAGADWHDWRWLPALAALITIAGVRLTPRLLPRVPGPIAGLLLGTLAFHGLVVVHGGVPPSPWLIGKLVGLQWDSLGVPLAALRDLPYRVMLPSAAALAVLTALNTLLTAVVADAATGLRHNARRTLMGQGMGTIASALAGGIAGSGTTAATLVAVKSGGARWVSGVVAVFFLVLIVFAGDAGRVLPTGALAGVIIAVAIDVADRDILVWARQRRTRQDAMIAVLVTGITVFYNLVAAVGGGVAIAILLFIREQAATPIVSRRSSAREARSIKARPEAERTLIEQHGERIVIFELRGNLFFGTTDRLIDELGPALNGPNWVILHLRKVTHIDLTAVKLLQQVANRLHQRGGLLLFCELHAQSGVGEDFEQALRLISDKRSNAPVRTFNGRDEALEFAENALLEILDYSRTRIDEVVPLVSNAIVRYLNTIQIDVLAQHLQARHVAQGANLFIEGESGDELYLVMCGQVDIQLRTTTHHYKRLAVYGAGSFFGELALLKQGPRAAHAVAAAPTDLMVLSYTAFDAIKRHEAALAIALLIAICDTLVNNQRWSTRELQRLSEW